MSKRSCLVPKSFTCVAVLAAAGPLAQTVSAAQLNYVAQNRSVRSDANAGLEMNSSSPQYRSQSATDFGPFDAEVSSQLVYDAFSTNRGAASQHSRLTPTFAQAYGSVSGTDALGFGGIGVGQGESRFVVSFTPDQASGYDFELNVAGTLGNNNSYTGNIQRFGYSASLIGPAGTVFDTGLLRVPARTAYSGQLTAGELYTLSVVVPNGFTGYASGSGAVDYSAILVVPEPAAGALGGTAALLLGRRRRRAG